MNEPGRLSETEMEVMQTIWDLKGPVTVQQVLDIFARTRGWKTSTLSTILSRLITKGFLTKSIKGKANHYTPTLLENEYKNYETQKFVSSVHGGSIRSFVAALANTTEMSSDEIAELRKWFQEIETR